MLTAAISITSLLFGSGVFMTLVRFLYSKQKQSDERLEALQLGVQALLRNKLLEIYYNCNNKGYADINERTNFENIFVQYERLGPNGVIDDVRNKFLKLPILEKEDKEGRC